MIIQCRFIHLSYQRFCCQHGVSWLKGKCSGGHRVDLHYVYILVHRSMSVGRENDSNAYFITIGLLILRSGHYSDIFGRRKKHNAPIMGSFSKKDHNSILLSYKRFHKHGVSRSKWEYSGWHGAELHYMQILMQNRPTHVLRSRQWF